MAVHAKTVAHGHVQGVFYRDTIKKSARARGVNGSAENLPDGTVEAHFEGEQSSVESMIEIARQGPPGAQVTELEVEWLKPKGFREFRTA